MSHLRTHIVWQQAESTTLENALFLCCSVQAPVMSSFWLRSSHVTDTTKRESSQFAPHWNLAIDNGAQLTADNCEKTPERRKKNWKRHYTACVQFANWERKLQKESSANLAVSPDNTDCYFEGEWLWISPFFALLCNFTESIVRKRKVHTAWKQTCRFREKANDEIEREEVPLILHSMPLATMLFRFLCSNRGIGQLCPSIIAT